MYEYALMHIQTYPMYDMNGIIIKVNTFFAGPCPPGLYSGDGFQPCTPCPIGSYQDETGADFCYRCNYGWTTPHSGAASADQCGELEKTN